MRVIVPVSLELVLFQDVWSIVLIPPVTLVVLACNLGLFFVLVRPKSWETRILGMMLAGVAAPVAVSAYYILGDFQNDRAGMFGRFIRTALEDWVPSLANPAGDLARAP